MISPPISSPVVDATGKTRFRESLERANARKGPSVGQWLTFPGYTVAKTVATLGEDVRPHSCSTYPRHVRRHTDTTHSGF